MQKDHGTGGKRLLVDRISPVYLAGKCELITGGIPSGHGASAFEVSHLSDSRQIPIRDKYFLIRVVGLFTVSGCGGDFYKAGEGDAFGTRYGLPPTSFRSTVF